jgi:DNA-binding transcriptional regulator WhiA
MTKQATFSRQIKDELCGRPCSADCCRSTEILAAFFSAGRFQQGSVTLSTAHVGWAARLTEFIDRQYQVKVGWVGSHELLTLTITDESRQTGEATRTPEENQPGESGRNADSDIGFYQRLLHDLRQLFDYDRDETASAAGRMGDCCRKALLRAVFLSCGSISEPAIAYHLELTIRHPAAARTVMRVLLDYGIRPGILERHGYHVVYLSEGQQLADYLLLAGAHRSLLTFESLRVEKEIRNSVNRAVNCDSANSQRIADTAARQLASIRQLADRPGLGVLPPDLRTAAEHRLAHPDLSLKELGELLQPPLGKSGMNHRLKRLEAIAAEILAKAGQEGGQQP